MPSFTLRQAYPCPRLGASKQPRLGRYSLERERYSLQISRKYLGVAYSLGSIFPQRWSSPSVVQDLAYIEKPRRSAIELLILFGWKERVRERAVVEFSRTLTVVLTSLIMTVKEG
ncbi:hypothetical protein [Clostridium phage CP3]|nr:hypothetical protein [Clostridium phage CP3]